MSFAAPNRPNATAALPLAAMIDILFLLLIFFLTVSAFRESERQIPIDLPTAEQGVTAAAAAPVVITVTSEGEIAIGQTIHTLETLERTMSALSEGGAGGPQVIINGDRQAAHGLIVQIMDLARRYGMPVAVGVAQQPGD